MNILRLEKRGCDFWKDSVERERSDLENHRLFGPLDLNLITNDDFKAKKAVCCEVEICTFHYDKKDIRKNFRNKTKTYIDVAYYTDNGNCYIALDYCKCIDDPTQKSVLETINKLFDTNYDALEIVDKLEEK